MEISTPLFDGKLVRLTEIDHENDPQIEAQWTQDPLFMRMMHTEPMRPLSVFQVRKNLEKLEKEMDEEKSLYHFRIRSLEDNRLLGFGELYWINWPNAVGRIRLGIGAAGDQHKGYGTDALRLLLGFAFREINLYRLTAPIPAYNLAALDLFKKAGFVQEVCRRGALARDGRRWDLYHYGLLASEWKA